MTWELSDRSPQTTVVARTCRVRGSVKQVIFPVHTLLMPSTLKVVPLCLLTNYSFLGLFIENNEVSKEE
jgi:hypothetical protein